MIKLRSKNFQFSASDHEWGNWNYSYLFVASYSNLLVVLMPR